MRESEVVEEKRTRRGTGGEAREWESHDDRSVFRFGPSSVASHGRLYTFYFAFRLAYSREASTTPCACALNSNEL